MKFNFFSKKNSSADDPKPGQRTCEEVSCLKAGDYRAPKKDGTSDAQQPETWHWFCLNHVKSYNQSWNYFSKMTEAEVIETWRKDMTWERPSWPLGGWHGKQRKTYQQRLSEPNFSDPFGLFEEKISKSHPLAPALTSIEQQARKTLGVSFPFTAKQLKIAYREGVKKFHPDLNQGCLKAEETFKQINHAYTVLKSRAIDFNG